jgi:hypothetical protein
VQLVVGPAFREEIGVYAVFHMRRKKKVQARAPYFI